MTTPTPNHEPTPPWNNIETWLQHGHQQGWCSPPLCHTHDGLGYTPQQQQQWDNGEDPCTHIIQLYENPTHKQQAENDNPALTWRTPPHWQQPDKSKQANP